MAVFAARFLVQQHLYDADQTGWLAVARIAMGWPLTAVAALVTYLAIRAAQRAVHEHHGTDIEETAENTADPASGTTDVSADEGAAAARAARLRPRLTATNSSSSPPSSGSSACGTITRVRAGSSPATRRAATPALAHRPAAPRRVVGQRDLDEVGLRPCGTP